MSKRKVEDAVDDDPFSGDELDKELEAAFDEFEADEDDFDDDAGSVEEEPDLEAGGSSETDDEQISEEDAQEVSAESDEAGAEPSPKLEPPASYNAEERADFLTLSPTQKQAAIRIEQGRRRHFQAITEGEAETRRQLQEVGEAYKGLAPILQREGRSFKDWVEGMARTQHFMQQDPLNAAKALLNRLQVDPRQLLDSGPQGQQQGMAAQQQPYRDPRVDELLRYQRAQQEEAQRRDYQSRAEAILEFQGERDESGQPLRQFMAVDEVTGQPVYPDFVQRMAHDAKYLKTQNPGLSHYDALSQAYDAAMRVHPAGQKYLDEQRMRKERAAAAQKAKEAKRAAASPSSSRGNSSSSATYQSFDEEIDALFA